MTSISIKVNGATATASLDGKLTSGMVGVPVTIEYDESWNGLYKTASFRSGNLARSREGIGTSTTVPWEVLRHSGKKLEIGVEGRDEDGNIVIPTIWAVAGSIFEGAVSSTPAAPNPDIGEFPTTGTIIDDSQISTQTTWSSQKISEEIGNGGGGSSVGNAVLYTEQTLTNEQQAQARENIGAVDEEYVRTVTQAYVDEAILGGAW